MSAILAADAGHIALPRRLGARSAVRTRSLLAADVLVLVGLLALGVLARLPELLAIPAFTDEVEEIALGLAILREGARPLTNVDPYIGPLWNYLLAGLFWLLGPSIVIPRALVLSAGVGTVLLTYLLGRAWHGRAVGLVGAALLGASAAHTAVNSHVAWSNCVTPLFTTAGLLALTYALRDDRPRLMVPAGLLFGLAFHTHPTALPVLLGGAAAVVVVRRSWLVGPWPYLAALAGGAANANLIVYNLLTGGRTFSYAQEIQASYEREVGTSSGYLERLGDLLVGLARTLSSSLDQRDSLLAYAANPLLILAVSLTVGGLVLAIRQRAYLPLLVVAASVLVLPLVNPKYEPILNVRYLAPILPICLLWIGLALAWLGRGGRTLGQSAASAGLVRRAGGVALATLMAASLIVGSQLALARYYDDVRENARTGARILEVVATARALGPAAQPVILDERLDRMSLGPGAGIVLRVLHLTLSLANVPTEIEWLGEERPPHVRQGQLVVLAARSKPQFTAEGVAALGLRAVNGGPARVHSQASRYGVYQFGPEPRGPMKTSTAPAPSEAGVGSAGKPGTATTARNASQPGAGKTAAPPSRTSRSQR